MLGGRWLTNRNIVEIPPVEQVSIWPVELALAIDVLQIFMVRKEYKFLRQQIMTTTMSQLSVGHITHAFSGQINRK